MACTHTLPRTLARYAKVSKRSAKCTMVNHPWSSMPVRVCVCVSQSAEGGMELVDNPAFSPDDDHDSKQLQPTRSPPSHVVATDGDVPQTSKITLDTLKFTSMFAHSQHSLCAEHTQCYALCAYACTLSQHR